MDTLRRISTLRGKVVAITGTGESPGSRRDLISDIKRCGGRLTADGNVTRATEILVRGESPFWKHGNHGTKEEKAASLIRKGADLSMILSQDLRRLCAGKAVLESAIVAGVPVNQLRMEASYNGLALDVRGVAVRRGEQSSMRRVVIGDGKTCRCALCGKVFPTSFLVAAHIKPRQYCSPSEKRDIKNIGMPCCQFGCDALFERGFVTVDKTGRIIVSRVKPGATDLSAFLRQLSTRRCRCHTSESENYFDWHRRFRFLGPA